MTDDDEFQELLRSIAHAVARAEVTRDSTRWSCTRWTSGEATIALLVRREGTALEFWDREATIGARWENGKLVEAVPETAALENAPIGPEEWYRPLSVVPADVLEELEQMLAGRRAQRRSWAAEGVVL